MARSRAGSISQALPSLRISTSPTSSSPPPISPLAGAHSTVNKAHGELRKLLTHLLSRLKGRPHAPSVYDGLRADSAKKDPHRLGAVVDSVKSAVRFKDSREHSDVGRIGEEDSITDTELEFSTDITYNYMIQLRDVLILSDRQGWQILHADAEAQAQRESSSLRKLRRASPQLGQRSRSPSFDGNTGQPDLLLECINILASVVSEDGRYKMASTRLLRPPYGLQGVCLDIAQILIKTHRHDAKVLSLVGFAVIPAFTSFESALHTRLLTFFEDGILRGILEELKSWQGPNNPPVKDVMLDHINGAKTPVVAIQVEEAVDEPVIQQGQQGWLQWSSTSTPIASPVLSAVAPSQPLVVYHLSSLIPPLLAAIFESIDPFENNIKDIPRLYRFHTLLGTIVSMKQDAYLDLLEVVAYHGASTRRVALAVLATFWPKALGHITIGKPLPVVSYSDSLAAQASASVPHFPKPNRDHLYAHEFMPWRFFSQADSSSSDHTIFRNCCQSCTGPIVGFGLLCPLCSVCVHLNCYDAPDGTFHGQYIPPLEADPRPYFLSFSYILPSRKDFDPDIIHKSDHGFRQANLFTLALCVICHKPLWGYVAQGMKCLRCHQCIHSSCMPAESGTVPPCDDSSLSSSHAVIDWFVLRQTFVDYYGSILFSEGELSKKTYEEISIYYSILWMQLRIFDSGISYRSITVDQRKPVTTASQPRYVDEFELQYFVRLYEGYLSSGRLAVSGALLEYCGLNKHACSNEHSILFDWSFLASVTSIIKTPSYAHPWPLSTPSNRLHVADPEATDPADLTYHPSELAILSQMRDALMHEFQLQSDHAARYMLSHICHLGFFDRIDSNNRMFDDPMPSGLLCSFPLPLGLDLSTSVETLVVAIEACLRDINIAVNEYGFLLLVRRFAPTGAASEYALTRLTTIVLSWILAEDDRLIIIARNHIARNLGAPGVRTPSDSPPWPSAITGHSTPRTVNSGGEYLLCRKQILARYATPWLAAVHGLDASLYTNCLYEHCVDVAEASDPRIFDDIYISKVDYKSEEGASPPYGEVILRSIIKLVQANVTFSSFESILVKWFDFVTPPGATIRPAIFKSLTRLFTHETDSSKRTSTLNDVTHSLPELFHVDPWKIFTDVATQSINGLDRSLLWLRVMAYSAVDIPGQTLKQLFGLVRDLRAPFTSTVLLLESTMITTWLKTFGSDGLDTLMIQINVIWADDLLFRMQSEDESVEILQFLRYSLVTCLLVYGCERQAIMSLGLIDQESLRNMPQRRRTMPRASPAPSTLEIDPQLVAILSRYVAEGPECVCAIVAKFLSILVSESVLLESHEIDHFILINGDALARCAWRFYDIDSQDISDIRISFLLRLLVVDSQPLDDLLWGFLQGDDKWQIRFQAVTQLFRILLDVNNPSFGVQDRQWKTSVTNIINHFFRALWLDDREEIRLAVDTWAHTLLPTHLRVISACWDEYMSKAPVADRARLTTFLIQLHLHFPSWQVLSWEVITECLLDGDSLQSKGAVEGGHVIATYLSSPGYPLSAEEREPASQQDDPEMVALRVSLVILSLQLVTGGAEVDLVNLLKIKLVLVKVLGFTTTSLNSTVNGQVFHVQFDDLHDIREVSFSCINPLMRVLDAPHKLALSPSSMGVAWNEPPVLGLVGDVFVDLVLKLWDGVANVRALPYLALRGLLECMILIIAKHELTSSPLKHLDESVCRAVKTVTDLVSLDTSYDIRHLCLAVMLAFMQGYPVLALKILGHQVQVLTRLEASLGFNIEDSLVSQTRNFLETAFVQYEVSGLFWLLSKQGRMSDDFFVMLRHVVNGTGAQAVVYGESLRDSIIRDTLSKVAASTNDRSIPDVLFNLERYVAICHHQNYPVSLTQHIGLRLTAIARQTADLTVPVNNRSATGFDPNPLLLMSATIVQHHKSQSIDLLLHTETLLRAALVRFDVNSETLKHLLHITSTIYRRSRTVDVSGAEIPTNHMAMGVLDVLSDSLKRKVRMSPSTLAAALEGLLSLHSDQNAYLPTAAVLRASTDAVLYLSYPTYRESYGKAEFAASLAIAKLILHASTLSETFLAQSLTGDGRNPAAVRVWNLVALVGLESSTSDAARKLLRLLPSFVIGYVSLLRVPTSGVLNESAAPNVNHAFASVKLWMLMARKACSTFDITEQSNRDSDQMERMIWNELWPPFERLLIQSLVDGPNGEMPPLLSFVWGCISDLMLFVRQARSVIALDTAAHVSLLNILRMSGRGELIGGKFARAQRSISEPLIDISPGILVNQVSGDVFTAEKLQATEAHGLVGFDRRREHVERGRAGTREL